MERHSESFGSFAFLKDQIHGKRDIQENVRCLRGLECLVIFVVITSPFFFIKKTATTLSFSESTFPCKSFSFSALFFRH